MTSRKKVYAILIPQAEMSLQALIERTGLSEVDIVNRAIQLYAGIDAGQRIAPRCPVRLVEQEDGGVVAKW